MNNKILQDRFESYQCQNWQEEEFAIKEIFQEITLAALSRANFFKKGSFQGGTALRILYGLDRFSEDLDFLLKKPDTQFDLMSFTAPLEQEFEIYGLQIRIEEKTKKGQTVNKIFLIQQSENLPLNLHHAPSDRRIKKVRIKMEVDTNPPSGSQFETKYGDFPYAFGLTVQDLPSLFAGKSHALLCRGYTKGRDWYDFLWYVSKKTEINYDFLSRACEQQGPWAGKTLAVDRPWYLEKMEKKIRSIDWDEAKKDVARFLKDRELQTLDLWNVEFFLDRLKKMEI